MFHFSFTETRKTQKKGMTHVIPAKQVKELMVNDINWDELFSDALMSQLVRTTKKAKKTKN